MSSPPYPITISHIHHTPPQALPCTTTTTIVAMPHRHTDTTTVQAAEALQIRLLEALPLNGAPGTI
jgi:hypothetical protein